MAGIDPLTSLVSDHLQALHRDGFVLMPAVLNAAQIKDLRHAIDHLKPRHWDYSGPDAGLSGDDFGGERCT